MRFFTRAVAGTTQRPHCTLTRQPPHEPLHSPLTSRWRWAGGPDPARPPLCLFLALDAPALAAPAFKAARASSTGMC